ncbi:Hypothetical predicted protein [Octopus vulgaris]|uniref:Uncharacterized protein n=1 Tax=Octopus vulgaris TaxID=6645 RepID=A0AA36B1V8_OCTVU|nr:Hypothetical predicted protein [Octopus vulgaris]
MYMFISRYGVATAAAAAVSLDNDDDVFAVVEENLVDLREKALTENPVLSRNGSSLEVICQNSDIMAIEMCGPVEEEPNVKGELAFSSLLSTIESRFQTQGT